MPEGFLRDWSNLFVYHYNPGATSYGEVLSMKQKFMRKIGKGGEGFWLSPTNNALYNYRLAIKARDMDAAKKFFTEYQKLSGKTGSDLKKTMGRQLENLFPLSGLTTTEAKVFIAQLSGEDRRRLYNSIIYWFSVVTGQEYNDIRLSMLEGYGVDPSKLRNGGK
jgi:hypothetical protein